jgi:hypothetical protein
VKICKVHTNLNMVDPLTKPLPQAKHEPHTTDMIKGPFGTAPAPDSKRGSGGAVPNGYFFKLILVWSRKIGSRFCEERWDLKKPAPPSLKTAP